VDGTCSMHGSKEQYKMVSWEDQKGKDDLEDLGVDERITMNYTLKIEDDKEWTEFS